MRSWARGVTAWVCLMGCSGGPREVPDVSVGSVTEPLHAVEGACVVGAGTCEGRRLCVEPGVCRNCDDPALERTYAETNQRSCARIRLVCGETQRSFSDRCGCGCEQIRSTAENQPLN